MQNMPKAILPAPRSVKSNVLSFNSGMMRARSHFRFCSPFNLVALLVAALLAPLAASRADILYMSDFGAGKIEKYDLSTGADLGAFATGLNTATGLAFDSAGNLYAANSGSSTIEKFTSGGVGSVFARTGLNLPMGLAFDSAGNLYAANRGNNTIEKFTPGGTASVFARTGLSSPYGLAFDSAGNLFVANEQNNTILTIIRELRELTPITSSSSRAALFLVLGLTC